MSLSISSLYLSFSPSSSSSNFSLRRKVRVRQVVRKVLWLFSDIGTLSEPLWNINILIFSVGIVPQEGELIVDLNSVNHILVDDVDHLSDNIHSGGVSGLEKLLENVVVHFSVELEPVLVRAGHFSFDVGVVCIPFRGYSLLEV